MSKKYDGAVIFEHSLKIYSENVYGIYINIEDENKNSLSEIKGQKISSYVSYLLSVSQFLKEGRISDDNKEWTMVNEPIHITYNTEMRLFLDLLLKGLITYKIVRIDPIDYDGDCLITDPKVIEQNGEGEVIKIGGEG